MRDALSVVFELPAKEQPNFVFGKLRDLLTLTLVGVVQDLAEDGAHVLALCTTPGQLDYFVALALQQHGQQSALCKGRG